MSTVLCETIAVHPSLLDESRSERRKLRAVRSPSRLTCNEKSSLVCEERAFTAKYSTEIGAASTDALAERSCSQPMDTVCAFPVPDVQVILPVPSTHVRVNSEASPLYAVASKRSGRARISQRERASSLAGLPRTRASTLVLSHTKAAPAELHTVTDDQTHGSFTPTGSPRESLLSLLAEAVPSSSRLSFHAPRRLSVVTDTASIPERDVLVRPPYQPISRSPNSPTIPSICRTPSSYTASDYIPTAPSSAGPPTPARSRSPSPKGKQKALHPVLESLEQSSKFRTQTCCATCKKAGTNFPCCPRCGDMWCSRACRLQSGGGKKHVCAK